jgi:hypothetical protein
MTTCNLEVCLYITELILRCGGFSLLTCVTSAQHGRMPLTSDGRIMSWEKVHFLGHQLQVQGYQSLLVYFILF